MNWDQLPVYRKWLNNTEDPVGCFINTATTNQGKKGNVSANHMETLSQGC